MCGPRNHPPITVPLPESLSGPEPGILELSCWFSLSDERGPHCISAYILPWLPLAPQSDPTGMQSKVLQSRLLFCPPAGFLPPSPAWSAQPFQCPGPLMHAVTPCPTLTDRPTSFPPAGAETTGQTGFLVRAEKVGKVSAQDAQGSQGAAASRVRPSGAGGLVGTGPPPAETAPAQASSTLHQGLPGGRPARGGGLPGTCRTESRARLPKDPCCS